MRSWVDTLERIIKLWKTKAKAGEDASGAGGRICEGIVQGVNYRADSTLLCKDFAPRVQTINILKTGTSQSIVKLVDFCWKGELISGFWVQWLK